MSDVSPCGMFKLPGTPPSLRRRRKRAELIFPMGQIHAEMYNRLPPGMLPDQSSAIYMAAVLEYLTQELVKMVGEVAKDYGISRITQRQIQCVIRSDPEFNFLVKSTIQWKHLDDPNDSDENEEHDDDAHNDGDMDSGDDLDMDFDDDEELPEIPKLGSGMATGELSAARSANESSSTDEDFVLKELDSATDRTASEEEECNADVSD